MPPDMVSRLWNFELLADDPDGSFFDFTMTRDAGYLSALRISPNGVRTAFTVHHTGVVVQMALQIDELHP
ncbi:MAG: hypothetical protein WBM04_04930 [Candidatus Korobacteraceae bacterium]